MEILIEKAEATTLIQGKVDLKTRTIARHKDEYFIMMRQSVNQENISTLNVYDCNNQISRCLPSPESFNNIALGVLANMGR